MKKYNGIYVNHIEYAGVKPCTPKRFHEALKAHFKKDLILPSFYDVLRDYHGNTCQLKYNYESKKYEVDHFYYSKPVAKRTKNRA